MGLSDREAIGRLRCDIRWKAAAGLGLTDPGFHPTVLTLWRARLRNSETPERVFDAVRAVVAETGVLTGRTKRVLDSTVLDDAVVTQDTVTMITAQIRKCRRLVPQAREVRVSRDYEQAGKPSCDWDDPQSRSGLINNLVTDGLAILETVEDLELDTVQADAVGLLAVVVGQDTGPDPDREGRWRIARRVAKDRTISVVDPQARHGRKTPSQRRDGYKAHIAAEPRTGIITACDITAANRADGPVGVELLEDEPAGLEIIADSAYGSGKTRAVLEEAEHSATVKPTTDGIPIAHHVFPGNTNDASTLPGVLDDLAKRFAVGRICVVADRGLISAANLETVAHAGFDHLLATRLRRDSVTVQALAAIDQDTVWVEIPQNGCRAADITLEDGTRTVVVESEGRARRDTQRTTEIVAAAETQLLALEHRVRTGRLKDPAKIGRAAQRILGVGGVGRLFDLEIGPGRFVYHYNEDNQAYEKLLAGRYVLTTSLTSAQADTTEIVACYRQLQTVETKFRVLGLGEVMGHAIRFELLILEVRSQGISRLNVRFCGREHSRRRVKGNAEGRAVLDGQVEPRLSEELKELDPCPLESGGLVFAVPDRPTTKACSQPSPGCLGSCRLRGSSQPRQCDLDVTVAGPSYQFIHRITCPSYPCSLARSKSCRRT